MIADAKNIRKTRVQRRKHNSLTVERVIAALRASAGIRSIAADKLGVVRSTVTKFIQKHPEIEESEAEIVDELIDLSEAKLISMIRSGEFPAVKFYLERKGGRAGYSTRVELSVPGGIAIKAEVIAVPDYTNLSHTERVELEKLMSKAAEKANGAHS